MLLRGLNKLIHIRCSYHTLHVLTTPFLLATHPLGHTQPKYWMLVLLLLIPGNRKLCPLGQIQLEAWFCMANEIRMACTVLKSCKKKKKPRRIFNKDIRGSFLIPKYTPVNLRTVAHITPLQGYAYLLFISFKIHLAHHLLLEVLSRDTFYCGNHPGLQRMPSSLHVCAMGFQGSTLSSIKHTTT